MIDGCQKQRTAAMQAAVLMENFSTHADVPRQRPAARRRRRDGDAAR
jgi:hypothetical protein